MSRVRGRDRGETLIEILVALSILGIAAVAILTGFSLAIKASDIQRKETTGGAYVRSYAEALEKYISVANSHYVTCAPTASYAPNMLGWTLATKADGTTHWVDASGAEVIPTGYTPTVSQVLSVSATGAVGTCSADTGLQAVTLNVASTDGRATEKLTVVIRKACVGTGNTPCN